MRIAKKILTLQITLAFVFFLGLNFVHANSLSDRDLDGVPDTDEINIYYTNPDLSDTDGDTYSDFVELNSGFSPHNPKPVRLEDNDNDSDGLSDRMELNFKTNLKNTDTDSDGYSDGDEIRDGFDPLKGGGQRLSKRIEVSTGAQKLSYFLGNVRLDTVSISSGKPSMPTPHGHFVVINKHPKAWSSYGLWMPYWMGLGNGRFGIHELPVWPNGYREGEDHLGKAVSHGCIRVGVGTAKFLYNWVEVGTPVYIY